MAIHPHHTIGLCTWHAADYSYVYLTDDHGNLYKVIASKHFAQIRHMHFGTSCDFYREEE